MILRPADLSEIYPNARPADVQELGPHIVDTMGTYAINTPLRKAHFLAQLGHESGELRYREEIASGQAYEGRRDLGNTQPGDGVLYKGRGLIMITGRFNYTRYAAYRKDARIVTNPRMISDEPEFCADVAGWYWWDRELNHLADQDDVVGLTRKINGGLNGLKDRRRLLTLAKQVLLV